MNSSTTIVQSPADSPRKNLEAVKPAMAKADLKNLDETWKHRLGRVLQRCFALAGRSQKEAAAMLHRDPAQIARWIAGTERQQFDVVMGVEEFRQPLVVALAEVAGPGIEVVTEIRVRRCPWTERF